MNDKNIDAHPPQPIMGIMTMVIAGTSQSPSEDSEVFQLFMDTQHQGLVSFDGNGVESVDEVPRAVVAGACLAEFFDDLTNSLNTFCPGSLSNVIAFLTRLQEITDGVKQVHVEYTPDLAEFQARKTGEEIPGNHEPCDTRPISGWVDMLAGIYETQAKIYAQVMGEIHNVVSETPLEEPESKEEVSSEEEESEEVKQMIAMLEQSLRKGG